MNSRWFRNLEFHLLFNQCDVFDEKINSGISLNLCPAFEDWEAPDVLDNEQDAIEKSFERIKQEFEAQNERLNADFIHCQVCFG